ncbi:hypothetical protein [Streptomyces phytophilus]|uniref:hypothetical protein n=1 Tax=Streptomyces phytophilus TaxID=722715 RepID=UPI0015F07E74|nr:hypothetical protein [Streptomyces phytophilus]
MERNDQPPPTGTPADVPARTRTCGTCNGKQGKTEHSTEVRAGQTVASETWRPCGSCNGSGQVPA